MMSEGQESYLFHGLGPAVEPPPRPQYDVPVVLVVFNRPDVTRRVFQAVARQRPRRLLVIADGARANRLGEDLKVREVRSIVEAVDWPCELSLNFANENMGCKRRVSSGIDWVFRQVDRAVILEDDCLPSEAFFRFCEEMLEEYREDQRVFAVSGSNFSGRTEPPGHYFSNFPLMWGWATWADRWRFYDLEPSDHRSIIARMWGRRPVAWAYWSKIFAQLQQGQIDTWDYQWILTVWRQSAVACRPTVNLVTNIGFGADATHTTNEHSALAGMSAMDVSGSFRRRIGLQTADPERDAVDERNWALISVRSLILMYCPWINRFRGKGS